MYHGLQAAQSYPSIPRCHVSPWLLCHSGRMHMETSVLHCFFVDKRIEVVYSVINYRSGSALEK